MIQWNTEESGYIIEILIIQEVNKDYKPMIEEPRTWVLNVIFLTVQILISTSSLEFNIPV